MQFGHDLQGVDSLARSQARQRENSKNATVNSNKLRKIMGLPEIKIEGMEIVGV